MRVWLMVAVMSVCAATSTLADTYTVVGNPQLVQAITIYHPEQPFGVLDFGYADITFANGVQRLGVPLESGILLEDERLPPALPRCGCAGFENAPLDFSADGHFFLAYYLSTPDPLHSLGTLEDGLLLRLSGDNVCVHQVRKTTFPANFVTVFENPDCLQRQYLGPSPALAARLRLLEFKEVFDAKRHPAIKWPEPFCLSCPPWPTYFKDRARVDQIHRQGLRRELARVIESSRKFLEQR
jgi:hypothetical protein